MFCRVVFMHRLGRRRRCESLCFVFADNYCDHLTNVHDLVHLAARLHKLAGLRHGNIGHNLVGLDLQQRLAFLDLVTGFVIPFQDFSFVDSFADVRKLKIEGHGYTCVMFSSCFLVESTGRARLRSARPVKRLPWA